MLNTSAWRAAPRRLAAGVLAALVVGLAAPAGAWAAGTLDRIRHSGKMTFGYVPDAAPLSSADASGKPTGFGIAICNKVGAAVQSELKLPKLALDFVPVTGEDRFRAIEQEKIDVLCGAVPTLERRAVVDFSIPILLGGTGVMVRKDAPARMIDVLAGRETPDLRNWRAAPAPEHRAIALVGGTPFEKALADRLAALRIVVDTVSVKDVPSGVQLLLDRKADAFFADRMLLLDAAQRSAASGELLVLGRVFKREPVALALGRGDENLRLMVDRALSRLYQSNDFRGLYAASFGPPDPAALLFYQLVALPD